MKVQGKAQPDRSRWCDSSPEYKSYMRDWDRLTVDRRGVLCRQWTVPMVRGELSYQQMLVPHSQRAALL